MGGIISIRSVIAALLAASFFISSGVASSFSSSKIDSSTGGF
jgi:hypothetical protein